MDIFDNYRSGLLGGTYCNYIFSEKLYILVESCTLGDFPYQSVSLAEDTFVTYTGCESSDGQAVNNYLLHLEISRGTYSVKVSIIIILYHTC